MVSYNKATLPNCLFNGQNTLPIVPTNPLPNKQPLFFNRLAKLTDLLLIDLRKLRSQRRDRACPTLYQRSQALAQKPKIRELLDESACTHNQNKKSACNAPTPGATTGGCAFEGAQISLFPYADTAHLVHGPMTCLGASWETRLTHTSWPGRGSDPYGLYHRYFYQ